MVWLPRKGEFGFSGGWRSFSLDMVRGAGLCHSGRTQGSCLCAPGSCDASWKGGMHPARVAPPVPRQPNTVELPNWSPNCLFHICAMPPRRASPCLPPLQKLFPGDCVAVELVPKAQHRGEQDTEFTLVLHVFR